MQPLSSPGNDPGSDRSDGDEFDLKAAGSVGGTGSRGNSFPRTRETHNLFIERQGQGYGRPTRLGAAEKHLQVQLDRQHQVLACRGRPRG